MSKILNVEALERAAEAKGLNQSRLAEILSVSREAVSNWFSGKSFPRPDKLLKLGMTLGLSYSELVKQDDPTAPIVAFRVARNSKTTEAHIQKAQDIGRLLAQLVPYLPFDQFAQPPILKAPTSDYDYLQQVAKKVRADTVLSETDTIDFQHLIRLFNDLQAVLVPVLWGSKTKHQNATHIYLPDSMTTWVYLNLDVNIHDFKFWMAHELGHALAPNLRGDEGEDFADAFAGVLLFPDKLAKSAYDRLINESASAQVNIIREIADEQTISLITVYRQINAYARRHDLEAIDLEKSIYAANTNFNKVYASLSEHIFDGEEIDASFYMKRAKDVFDTPFFDALGKYLREHQKSASFVQTVLDIGLIDAKGIYAELT